MTKLKKGDRVWVAGFVGYPDKCLTAEQVTVKSSGDALVELYRSVSCAEYKTRLPRAKVFPTPPRRPSWPPRAS
jgi:hypothetical protein